MDGGLHELPLYDEKVLTLFKLLGNKRLFIYNVVWSYFIYFSNGSYAGWTSESYLARKICA